MILKKRLMEGCEPFLKIGTNGIGVIFQHGGSGTPASMKYATDYFYKKGYTVVAPRLAGHGTDVRDLSRSNLDDFRADLESAISILRSCCDKVILCGLSMGAMLSAIVGSYADIDGLVLMCGPGPDFNMGGAHAVDSGNKSPELNGWYKPELMQNWKVYNQKEMMGYMAGIMGEFLEGVSVAIPEIRVPTQLIYSKGDKVVSYNDGEKIYEMIPAENKHIRILEHSGHVVTADGERDLVFEIIQHFIEREMN